MGTILRQGNSKMKFVKNKYYRWYYQIIDKARKRGVPDEYYEKHHVVPKCLGGTDSEFNIVKLTYREHILVHWILIKMTTGKAKKSMIWALFRMAGTNYVYGQPRDPPRWLVVLAKNITKNRRSGSDNPTFGRNLTAEQKAHLRAINLGKKYGPMSEEQKLKISKSNTGLKRSEETRRRIKESRQGKSVGVNNHFYGKKHTDETKKIMKEKRKFQVIEKGRRLTDATRLKISKSRIGLGCGERNGFSKLTEAKIMQIRYKFEVEKQSMTELGKQFDVSDVHIGRIIQGKVWKHLYNKPVWSTPTIIEIEV